MLKELSDIWNNDATFKETVQQHFKVISAILRNSDMSKNINLQLAPSLHHQCAAMLSVLRRYKWHQFGIATSQIAGHNDFLLAMRDLIMESEPQFRYILLETKVIDSSNTDEVRQKLTEIAKTETRIILLYSTREEAATIFDVAQQLRLTGKDYVWIVTHSVIGNIPEAPFSFPSGMLGVHFDTGFESLLQEIEKAVKVFSHGLELFLADHPSTNGSLQPNLSCVGKGDSRWANGELFYRYLRNTSVAINSQSVEFKLDGTLRHAELDIMNLNNQLKWDKIGKWTSEGLDIKDIVWPGNAHVPPPGVPEKFHLKIVFLEEPAFINLAPPDPVTGQCINHGVHCKVGKESDFYGLNATAGFTNASLYKCCSGLSVDLLEKYADDLGFSYEMFRVEDGYWGAEVVNVNICSLIAKTSL
uniref:Receptor ligand binding region domain-containing protein n=1 Tax=Strigamia maritima TaxID=126957 RepID=T1J731_STRMM